MSPRKVTAVENGALSRIAERVLNVPSLTHEHSHDGTVIAVHAELVVRPGALSAPARQALEQVAEPVGNLATMLGPAPSWCVRTANLGERSRRTTSPTPAARSARWRSGA